MKIEHLLGESFFSLCQKSFRIISFYQRGEEKNLERLCKVKKTPKINFWLHFPNRKNRKNRLEKNRFFSIFRKIDLIDFFDSITSPIYMIYSISLMSNKERYSTHCALHFFPIPLLINVLPIE